MHYFKRNIGDYHKKAGRLSMLQHGAYTLLIDACYDREIFPTIEEAIDWCWASNKDEIEAVEFVLKKFFFEEDGLFIQQRIQDEVDNYHKNSATNKQIALKREAKRREKSTKRARKVNEAPPNYELITNNHKPLTNNQSTKDLDQSEIDQEVLDYCFNQFWESGIRKVNKKKAKVLFFSVVKKNRSHSGLTSYDFTTRLEQDIKARINAQQMGFSEMHPTTYLNGERWTDEIKEANHGQYQQPNQQRLSTVEQSLRETAAYGEEIRLRREERQTRRGDDEALGIANN